MDKFTSDDWAEIEPPLFRYLTLRCRQWRCDTPVDDVLRDTYVVASRHFDAARGPLRPFCLKAGRGIIISDLRSTTLIGKEADSNVENNRRSPRR